MPLGVGRRRVAVVGGGGAVTAGHRLERSEVEPGAERLAFARQHDGAHPRFGLQLLAGVARAPANIAPSRALRLSGRFSRTSATPCVVDGRSVTLGRVTAVDRSGARSLSPSASRLPHSAHEAEPDRRRGAHHDPLGPQAPRLRPAGRPGDRRGVPRDRPAGADRVEPPGLALGRRRGRRQEAGHRRRSTRRNFDEYRSMPGAEYERRRHPRRAPGQGASTRRATWPTTSTARR